MRIGDRLLAVDGRELRRRPLARVIRPQPTHCFNVLRLAPSRMDALPLSAAAKEHLRAAALSGKDPAAPAGRVAPAGVVVPPGTPYRRPSNDGIIGWESLATMNMPARPELL